MIDMNAKDYLENIRRIDKLIRDKQTLHDHYMDMATRATSRMTATRVSGTADHSPVADWGVKLVDLERELKRDIDDLYAFRQIAAAAVNSLSDSRLREVIELRYFRGYEWMRIAREMGFDRSSVWRLNAKALAALQDRLPLGA